MTPMRRMLEASIRDGEAGAGAFEHAVIPSAAKATFTQYPRNLFLLIVSCAPRSSVPILRPEKCVEDRRDKARGYFGRFESSLHLVVQPNASFGFANHRRFHRTGITG